MANKTVVSGIFQGDVVVRTAVLAALDEFRQDPTLIEDALACLAQDELTAGRYGEKTIEQCKEWFAGIDIPVKLGINFANLEKVPAIAIELGNGTEQAAVLGDKHYDTSEPDPHRAGNTRTLESVRADESYTIALFASGEPEYLLFLWTLVLFGVMRNKEQYLEARGFEVERIQYGVAGALDWAQRENLLTRAIVLSGKVQHSWPKRSEPAITRTEFGVRVEGAQVSPFDTSKWDSTDILSGVRARPA